MDNPGKKILVIRFSSIGDIVLTTPVIRCLKEQVPGTEIHYLVKKQFLPVIKDNPHISKVWEFDDNFDELIPLLRGENFDHVIDLHKNFRSLFVRLKLHCPASSFPKLNFRKWILVNLRVNLLPGIHIVDRYFNAVKKLGVINDGQGLGYFIPPGEEVDLQTLPVAFRTRYTVFAIGGRHYTKILPEEKIIEIARKLTAPLILLGGEEDRERGDRIAAAGGDGVYNVCGKLSISQSASLIRQAKTVITHDTGLMHIAAAFRKSVISIWGNTVPEFGMYPYFPEEYRNNSVVFEVPGLSCRPCSKLGYRECPKKHFKCMKEQDTDAIVHAVENK
jgi:ADP-heptose:LPS heptosyltransferase